MCYLISVKQNMENKIHIYSKRNKCKRKLDPQLLNICKCFNYVHEISQHDWCMYRDIFQS